MLTIFSNICMDSILTRKYVQDWKNICFIIQSRLFFQYPVSYDFWSYNLIIGFLTTHKRYRRNQTHWFYPINQRHDEFGMFYTLTEDLKNNDQYINYFFKSIRSFDGLNIKLKNVLQRQNTQFINVYNLF